MTFRLGFHGHYEVLPPSDVWLDTVFVQGAGNPLASITSVSHDQDGNILAIAAANMSGVNKIALMKFDEYGTSLWARIIGSTAAANLAGEVRADDLGNVYLAGRSNVGTNADALLVKSDSSGAQQWQRTLAESSSGTQNTLGVDIDSSGNVYVVGSSSNATASGFLAKFSSNGTLLWQKETTNGSNTSSLIGCRVTNDDQFVYVLGTPNNSSGVRDVMLAKVNASDGSLAWQVMVDSGIADSVGTRTVSVFSDDTVAIAFYNLTSPATTHVAKFGTDGVLSWMRSLQWPGNGDVIPYDVSVDGNGNVYVTGQTTPSGGTIRGFLAKYSSVGTLLWQKWLHGGANGIGARGVSVLPAGDLVVAGLGSDGTNNNLGFILRIPSDGSLNRVFDLGLGTLEIADASLTASTPSMSVGGSAYSWFNGSLSLSGGVIPNDPVGLTVTTDT